MQSPLRYFVVDAFASQPFAGNPAAVVPLSRWRDNAWLQNVAMEMNLSETAFFVPNADGFDLRWFTPKVEVDLCGHATLASAMVLSHLGKLPDGADVNFSTRSGVLKAFHSGTHFQLDFPLKPEDKTTPPVGLIEALHVQPVYVGRNQFDYLVEVDSETTLRAISPDFKQLSTVDCRGIIVTARSDDRQFDFVSRFFAPANGVPEDPVCGSGNGCAAALVRRERLIAGSKYVASQGCRVGRAGRVEVEFGDDDMIWLGGHAVTCVEGTLRV
jgi:PhzF family phenazine biosynthesis protein